MPQVVTAGPANGWYGSSLFGAGGFGAAGGSFPNQFGGGFNTGPNGSAWGNETFVPPVWGIGPNAGTGLLGSSRPNQDIVPPTGYGSSGNGAPQGYAPGYNTLTGFGGGFGGGSALSGGYGAPASPGSIGGGSPFGGGGGFVGGGSGTVFPGGGSPFPSGGSPESGTGQAPQFSALSSSLGSGGSITPQYLAEANSLGWSSPEAQAFASLAGQQQQQQQVNPADLPSQFAGEMMGGPGHGAFSPQYTLAQVIQSEAGLGNTQEGQFAVAATMANREADPAFAQQYGDLLGQANAPGQFAGHLTGPGGPGRIVPLSDVSASAQQIADALQNGTLGNMGQLGNALYFLAQSSLGGAQMARGGGTPMGGGTVATNNVFSNVLSPWGPSASYIPPSYTLGNMARAAADPFGTAFGGMPSGLASNANFFASGFPILQSGAGGYGYPAYGASTMSDSLLANMGFDTGGDISSQLLGQMGVPTGYANNGYGDVGYGGGYDPSAASYGDIGGYSPSYGPDFSGGGVTDLGYGPSGSFDSGVGGGGSFDYSGASVDSGGYSGGDSGSYSVSGGDSGAD